LTHEKASSLAALEVKLTRVGVGARGPMTYGCIAHGRNRFLVRRMNVYMYGNVGGGCVRWLKKERKKKAHLLHEKTEN